MKFKKEYLNCLDCGKKIKRLGGKHKRCQNCSKKYRKVYITKHKREIWYPKHCEERKKDEKERRAKRREYLFKIVGNKCVICKYDKYKSSLDMHHINNGQKETRHEHIYLKFKDFNNLVCLCKNCHNALHHKEINLDKDGLLKLKNKTLGDYNKCGINI